MSYLEETPLKGECLLIVAGAQVDSEVELTADVDLVSLVQKKSKQEPSQIRLLKQLLKLTR